MITIEQKVDQFRRMVLGHAQNALEEKVAVLDQSDLVAVENMKRDLEKLGTRHIEEHVKLAMIERKRLLAKAQLNKIHSLLKVKHEFVESVIEEMGSKARIETTQSTYKANLFSSIQAYTDPLLDGDRIRIYLMPESMLWSQELKSQLSRFKSVEVIEATDDIIGGFILESLEKGERYDLSFRSRIIYSEAVQGGRIFEILNEGVENHE